MSKPDVAAQRQASLIVVYQVNGCFSNVAGAHFDDDKSWLCETWDEAAALMHKCLAANPDTDVIVSLDTMSRTEYEALPEGAPEPETV